VLSPGNAGRDLFRGRKQKAIFDRILLDRTFKFMNNYKHWLVSKRGAATFD
jgi:hypothetical protein